MIKLLFSIHQLPIIYGIPSTTSIREDHSSEKVMFSFIVYDRSLPMDTITCSLDTTPSTDIFSLTEEGPGTVDIINKEKGYFDTYNLTNKIHRSIF